ncbi:hypothetical protein K439DRAFT_1407789 [Ramaria rubella]|nr:hypothetical protein K439DRAFT_1407789 [Ramaria rubella]
MMVDIQNHSSQPPPSRYPSHSTRPSSRRALTAALELAQEAVRLDTTNDDPIGAIHAYSRSVALLSEVMERVMRGEDGNDSGRDRRRGGRRRSVVAKEEEVRRLKSIHDTYADRMNILSDIYNVDPYSTDASTERQSNFSDDTQVPMEEPRRSTSIDDRELIGSAMLAPSRDSTSTPDSSRTSSDQTYTTDNSLPEFEMVHPPSFQHKDLAANSLVTLPNAASSAANARASVLPPPRPPPSGPLPTRPRNGSVSSLPPPVPPPRIAPPPPPSLPPLVEPTPPSHSKLLSPGPTRPRGNSTTAHSRTNSDNRLEALQEEPDIRSSSRNETQGTSGTTYFRQPNDPAPQPRYHLVDEDRYRASIIRPPSQYSTAPPGPPPPPPAKDTPPLPPLPRPVTPPSPSSTTYASSLTPRVNPFVTQPHPFAAQDPPAHVARTRGISTPTYRSDNHSQTAQLIINPNTAGGTISQRRSKSSTSTLSSRSSSPSTAVPSTSGNFSQPPPPPSLPVVRLTASSLPASTANSLGIGRSRSSSQPPRPVIIGANSSVSEFGVRPSGSSSSQNIVNAQGSLPRKPSFPSRFNPVSQAATGPNVSQQSSSSSYLPSSPLPSVSPMDPLRKPYHLMSLLRITMTSKSGGYITRRLHVPHEVWSQGGAKLLNLPEKVRVVEILCGALEEVQHASNELTLGASVSGLTSAGGRKEVERWLTKLDEWNGACEGVVGSMGKKLGVGEGFGAKKSGGVTSWSGKFARSFDRMTNGKNLDSPASYVLGLTKLFQQAQLLDEHTKALVVSPPSPLYSSLSPDLRQPLELKLKRSSEFFASVVLTFVVRDLSQLLDKYVKKGEKWLAE